MSDGVYPMDDLSLGKLCSPPTQVTSHASYASTPENTSRINGSWDSMGQANLPAVIDQEEA